LAGEFDERSLSPGRLAAIAIVGANWGLFPLLPLLLAAVASVWREAPALCGSSCSRRPSPWPAVLVARGGGGRLGAPAAPAPGRIAGRHLLRTRPSGERLAGGVYGLSVGLLVSLTTAGAMMLGEADDA
jgi:hypothetical protein